MFYHLVRVREDGGSCFVSFSEELFRHFLWDPVYLERFAFLGAGKWEWRLTGKLKKQVEELLTELSELNNSKQRTAADLERVVLLRLLFVLEEGKAYLTPG